MPERCSWLTAGKEGDLYGRSLRTRLVFRRVPSGLRGIVVLAFNGWRGGHPELCLTAVSGTGR